MLAALRRLAAGRAARSPATQAELDFGAACPLLESHERRVAEAARGGAPATPEALLAEFEGLEARWRTTSLAEKVAFANDSMTIQLSEMFQHVADIDAGDVAAPAELPRLPAAEARASAAFTPSVGPSTHTNPAPTLAFQMKRLHAEASSEAAIAVRRALTARHGFSLWLGPSQAPTATAAAGVYLQGRVPPGTVVGLYPGAAFNAEMLQKAADMGHLGSARVPRTLVPRLDGCLLDVHAAEAPRNNPYALAHHVRHPPPSIYPNVLRLQYDFVAPSDMPDAGLPFPAHLRDYIPNVWGADATAGAQLHGMLEQHIWAKGIVLIALRPLWDEELFVDHALPLTTTSTLPPWYTPITADRNRRLWPQLPPAPPSPPPASPSPPQPKLA